MTTTIDLRRDAFRRLVLTLPGAEPVAVVPVRAFPFSQPDGLVSLCDAEGREVLGLRTLDELPADARALVAEELEAREFIPVIRRILSVSPGAEPTTWHVVTDRGETRFVLTSEDHVRRLPNDGALISDGDGVRYRIAGLGALDAASRRFLHAYL